MMWTSTEGEGDRDRDRDRGLTRVKEEYSSRCGSKGDKKERGVAEPEQKEVQPLALDDRSIHG